MEVISALTLAFETLSSSGRPYDILICSWYFHLQLFQWKLGCLWKMNLLFSVLFFFVCVSNVHIYIKSVVVFSFEVRGKGMRCCSVRVNFLVPACFFQGKHIWHWRCSMEAVPCSAPHRPAQQGKVIPPKNQGKNFSSWKTTTKVSERGGRQIRGDVW